MSNLVELEFLKKPKSILLIILNIPICYLYFKIIFGDLLNFGDSVRQAGQFDLISFFKGNLLDDWWHTLKIIVWLLLCYKTIHWEYNYFIGL